MSGTPVCDVSEVPDDEILRRELPGAGALAVYRVGDEFYVTSDVCTHSSEASLAEEGFLEGYEVECSWHGGRFDIRTGKPRAFPCTVPLRIFPVTVVDGAVTIDLGG